MIEIFDDLIPYSYLEDIQNYFLNGNAPWTFMPSMTYGEEEGDMESFGLSISICNHGRFEQTYQATLLKGLLYTILEQTGQKQIFRSRIDMTLYNPDGYRHEVHTDLPDNMKNITTIFYVNDSDGDTLIYNDTGHLLKAVKPRKNRLLVFDGSLPHTGHSPSNHKSRVLINTNCM